MGGEGGGGAYMWMGLSVDEKKRFEMSNSTVDRHDLNLLLLQY